MKLEEKDSPSKNDQIEEYLSAQYEFRYNTVLHRAEYRPRGEGGYTAVDRYRINTLKRALNKEANIQTSTDNLYSIIESDFSPRINPVQRTISSEKFFISSEQRKISSEELSQKFGTKKQFDVY